MPRTKKTTDPASVQEADPEETSSENTVAPKSPEPEQKPETPAEKPPFPYTATVAVAFAAVRKTANARTRPVGTLKQGTKVTVTDRRGEFVQLANGLWIREAFLTR